MGKNDMHLAVIVGNNISELRNANNFTLKKLSEKTGLSIALISRIENGQISPSIHTLEKIAASLGVEISDLLQKESLPAELKLEIAEKIRQRMNLLGLTTQTMAEQCGLPPLMLKQLLKNEITLSIQNLLRIASALKVDLKYFFENYHNHNFVISRKDNRPMQEWIKVNGKPMYLVEILFGKFPNQLMEPVISTHIGKEQYMGKISHHGEEFFYVLEGTIKLFLDDKEILLETGDAIYFDSSLPHAGISIGDKPAKTLHTHFTPQTRIKNSLDEYKG